MSALENMTWNRWSSLPRVERERLVDLSGLTPQLCGYEGYRVEVLDEQGATPRRFNVGRSAGWKPCHIELHNTRSRGGISACGRYFSVRVIRRVG